MVKVIGILDYGCGNLQSVFNAFRHIGVDCKLVDNPSTLGDFSHLVLPGVGSYRRAMRNLVEYGFEPFIKEKVAMGTPILGICLGMQLLGSRSSEDGETKGLSFIRADVDMLEITDSNPHLKVPHVGFNSVHIDKSSKIFKGFEDQADFYFTHSYRMQCNDSRQVVGTTYHSESFVAAVEHLNIFGTQFHPEKSQQNGLRVLSNFVDLQ